MKKYLKINYDFDYKNVVMITWMNQLIAMQFWYYDIMLLSKHKVYSLQIHCICSALTLQSWKLFRMILMKYQYIMYNQWCNVI